MNTLMAGAGNAGRGRYTAAGYAYSAYDEANERESDLYIGKDRAGFARELIRDNNRVGYSAQELDDDGIPFSFFIDEAARSEKRAEESRERKAGKQAKQKEEMLLEELTFSERVFRAMRRERSAAMLCGVLFAVNLTLFAFFCQGLIDGVQINKQIQTYESGMSFYQMEIDSAKVRIAEATRGDLIRNKAQNELGMLRGERVATQKIYIQASNLSSGAQAEQTVASEERGLLDWLLSVADIFDFKS